MTSTPLPAGYAREPVTGRITHDQIPVSAYWRPVMLMGVSQLLIAFRDRRGELKHASVPIEHLYGKPKLVLGLLGRGGLWVSTDPAAQQALLHLLNTWEPPLRGGEHDMQAAIAASEDQGIE